MVSAKNESPIHYIHVVDDDPVNLYLFSRILKKQGFEVSVSESGKEALSVIKEKKPDLVITDVIMPVMTGFELLSQIKSAQDTKHIRVILVTGLLNSEDHKKTGLDLGAEKILNKPLSENELINALQELDPS